MAFKFTLLLLILVYSVGFLLKLKWSPSLKPQLSFSVLTIQFYLNEIRAPIIVKCNYIKSVYSSAKKRFSYKAKKIKHYLHFEEIKNFLYYFVGNNLHVTLLS